MPEITRDEVAHLANLARIDTRSILARPRIDQVNQIPLMEIHIHLPFARKGLDHPLPQALNDMRQTPLHDPEEDHCCSAGVMKHPNSSPQSFRPRRLGHRSVDPLLGLRVLDQVRPLPGCIEILLAD